MIIDWLLQPLSLIWLWLAFTGFIALVRGAKIPAAFVFVGFVALWVLSAPEFSNRWIQALESSRVNPDFCADAAIEHIVVPGGGMNPWIPNSDASLRLNRDSMQRAIAAATLGDANSRWYTLGAGANEHTLAEDMADIMTMQGVATERILLDTASRSTIENAANLQNLLPSETDSNLIHLVTSALHVNRAAQIFEDQGYRVCHINGVDSRYSVPAPPTSLLPYLGGLEKSTLALREQLARLKRRLLN